MRPRRTLHLIDTGGPGGAETVFLELVRGLPALGWETLAVVPEDDWLAGALRSQGIEPRTLVATRSFDLAYARALRSLIRTERIELVQTHLLGTSVYAALSVIGTGVPVVSTFHGHPDVPAHDRLKALKLRVLRRNAVVCVSESLRAHFRDGLGFPGAVEVIHNGIDTRNEFCPRRSRSLRRELGIPDDAPLLGAVGNVRASKAYDVLLRAFARVREALPGARLVVAGQTGGALHESLLGLRGSLGLEEACHFLGFRSDVPDVLATLDVFVLSSSDEGFSLATVQAMSMALPVVATRCGGPERIVGDSGGARLVPVGDPDALAAAVLSLLERPDEARELGRRARARAEEAFSIDRMLARYDALYRGALDPTAR